MVSIPTRPPRHPSDRPRTTRPLISPRASVHGDYHGGACLNPDPSTAFTRDPRDARPAFLSLAAAEPLPSPDTPTCFLPVARDVSRSPRPASAATDRPSSAPAAIWRLASGMPGFPRGTDFHCLQLDFRVHRLRASSGRCVGGKAPHHTGVRRQHNRSVPPDTIAPHIRGLGPGPFVHAYHSLHGEGVLLLGLALMFLDLSKGLQARYCLFLSISSGLPASSIISPLQFARMLAVLAVAILSLRLCILGPSTVYWTSTLTISQLFSFVSLNCVLSFRLVAVRDRAVSGHRLLLNTPPPTTTPVRYGAQNEQSLAAPHDMRRSGS